MNRTTAVACYKDIMSTSENIKLNSVNLVSLKNKNSRNEDYQMHIVFQSDEEIKQQVTNVVKKHSLALKENQNKMIIYTP